MALELGSAEQVRVILCPGDYVAREDGVYSAAALDFIRRYTVDKVFVGAGGLTIEGPTDADTRGVWLKRAMLERGRRALLLVDHGKFELHRFEVVAPLDRINDVINDRPPPKELAKAIGRAGVEIHDAGSSPPPTS